MRYSVGEWRRATKGGEVRTWAEPATGRPPPARRQGTRGKRPSPRIWGKFGFEGTTPSTSWGSLEAWMMRKGRGSLDGANGESYSLRFPEGERSRAALRDGGAPPRVALRQEFVGVESGGRGGWRAGRLRRPSGFIAALGAEMQQQPQQQVQPQDTQKPPTRLYDWIWPRAQPVPGPFEEVRSYGGGEEMFRA